MLKQRNFIFATLLFFCAISFAASRRIDTPLHDAIKSNKTNLGDALETVNKLLEKGNIDLSLQDSDGNTALHEAIIQSQNLQSEDLINLQKVYHYQIAANIVDAVIKKYPQKLPPRKWWHRFFRRKFMTHGQVLSIKNSLGETPLYLAAKVGSLEIVKKLCKHGALDFDNTTNPPYQETPLQAAKKNKQQAIIKVLSKPEWGEDVKPDDSHKKITQKKQPAKLREEENEKDAQLLKAVNNGNAQEVQRLIDNGADIYCENNNGETPLHLAAINGNSEIIELLYQAAKQKDDLLEAVDKKGNSPLHFAVYSENNTEAVIKKLIELGADPSTKNFANKTPAGLANEANPQLSQDVFTQSQKQTQENNGNNINIIYQR